MRNKGFLPSETEQRKYQKITPRQVLFEDFLRRLNQGILIKSHAHSSIPQQVIGGNLPILCFEVRNKTTCRGGSRNLSALPLSLTNQSFAIQYFVIWSLMSIMKTTIPEITNPTIRDANKMRSWWRRCSSGICGNSNFPKLNFITSKFRHILFRRVRDLVIKRLLTNFGQTGKMSLGLETQI